VAARCTCADRQFKIIIIRSVRSCLRSSRNKSVSPFRHYRESGNPVSPVFPGFRLSRAAARSAGMTVRIIRARSAGHRRATLPREAAARSYSLPDHFVVGSPS
jgi:hypothetical protein